MSLNRKTQAYQNLVKKISKDFRYRPMRRVNGIGPYRDVTVEEVIAEKYADLPRYAIEDALVLLIGDLKRSADFSEEHAQEQRGLAAEMEESLRAYQRPRLKIVGGKA